MQEIRNHILSELANDDGGALSNLLVLIDKAYYDKVGELLNVIFDAFEKSFRIGHVTQNLEGSFSEEWLWVRNVLQDQCLKNWVNHIVGDLAGIVVEHVQSQ